MSARCTKWLAVACLAFALPGCYSQNRFATEACWVAFRSTDMVVMWKFKETDPYTYERPGRVIVNFAQAEGTYYRAPTQGECEFTAPIESGDIPELLSMHLNGNFLSQDKVATAQAAIVSWVEKKE